MYRRRQKARIKQLEKVVDTALSVLQQASKSGADLLVDERAEYEVGRGSAPVENDI